MVIISADYDQIELRLAAALAGETTLIEAAKRNESLHKVAAIKLFGVGYTPDQYRYTKNVNFGWLYGGGPKTLSEQAGIPYADAQKIIREYQESFPSLTRYKRKMQESVLRSALSPQEYRAYRSLLQRMWAFRSDTKDGRKARAQIQNEIEYMCYNRVGYITTPTGRRVLVDARKPYTATNYVVQSFAADVFKQGLLDVMDDPELEPTVLLPIHDELLGQARRSKAERIARRYGEVMSTEFNGVPISATGKVYGKSWGHGYRK